ncbi:Uncharacterized protein SCF082_LOCUS51225 [Durusdinium trenchii]|uniref:Uncharacterized protein n=1 Tax=Durusdinium trenchii TaxID=1381693 RepID=A0ABP0SD01_9DINO
MLQLRRVSVATLIARAFGWQLRCLVLSASRFQHILNDPGQTSKAYADHAGRALSLVCAKRRGTILQEFCKKELARLHPHSTIEEPTQGTRSNGARRSALDADYDFTLDVRKIECKSAQMSWDKFLKCWHVHFHAVKMPWPGFRDQAPFDDLYLIMFSPDSLHIIKHDFQTGVTTAGKRTGSSSHEITVRGARGQECWQISRSQILDKLLAPGHCELVARIDLSATKARAFLAQQMEGLATRQDTEYERVPLSQMTPALRGLRIEEIAFEVDRQVLHPNSSFSRTSSKVDWVRGEVRVEVKHGMMRFDKGRRRWRCSFRNIKCDLFDELGLAIYSPFGIHFLKHPGGQVRFSLTGLKEQAVGKEMHVLGSQKLLDVREALDDMLKKMEEWGCQRLATILW